MLESNQTAATQKRTSGPAKIDEIRQFDHRLREQLKFANASPFLGQYDLPPGIEDGIDLLLCTSEPADALISFFRVAPAAAVCFVARIASAKTGSESAGEFYPHLEERLDHKLSGLERNELGKTFRQACVALLLPVPIAHTELDSHAWKWRREYLMQAGVIRSDLAALAMAALDTEDRLGLLDGFDFDEIRGWQSELAESFLHGHKLLKQTLDLDADAWHASAIGRLRRGEQAESQWGCPDEC